MSNYLSIAAVTASLRTLVSRAIQIVPGAQVSTVRPDGLGTGTLLRGVNVFLYMITPNAAFENDDQPLRGQNGVLLAVPRTPIDLHYLFTFYGDDSRLEPQLLLGATLAAFRQQPILTPALIEETIRVTTQPDLTESNLAQEQPRVTVRPETLSSEALARVWSVFFQVPYSLSAGFECSVVFVDSPVVPPPRPITLTPPHITANPTP
jgi:hypothetical protein